MKMLKWHHCLAALSVAACLTSAPALADHVPVATGGEKKMLSHSLSADGTKIEMVVTHTFTNAAEVESLVFNKAATVDVLVVGGGGGGGASGGGGAGGGNATSTSKPSGGNGVSGTGSGGGGGSVNSYNSNYYGLGGNGGSGIVVVRHRASAGAGLAIIVR